MRNVFFNLLHQRMREDKNLFLLIGDVGLGLVDPIQKEFPDRFLNVGIAEQNMIGIDCRFVQCRIYTCLLFPVELSYPPMF